MVKTKVPKCLLIPHKHRGGNNTTISMASLTTMFASTEFRTGQKGIKSKLSANKHVNQQY